MQRLKIVRSAIESDGTFETDQYLQELWEEMDPLFYPEKVRKYGEGQFELLPTQIVSVKPGRTDLSDLFQKLTASETSGMSSKWPFFENILKQNCCHTVQLGGSK